MTAEQIAEIIKLIKDTGEECIPGTVTEVQRGMLSSFSGMISCRVGLKLLESSEKSVP